MEVERPIQSWHNSQSPLQEKHTSRNEGMYGVPQTHSDTENGRKGASPSGIPEISSLVVAASQHLWLVLFLAIVVGGILEYFAWTMVEPSYRATSFVHVRQRSDYLLAQRNRSDDASFVRAQESKVVLPQVIQRALESPQVESIAQYVPERNQQSWLTSRVTVDLKGGAEAMTISVDHHRPEVAQILANALAHSYVTEVNETASNDRTRRRAELERLAAIADQRLTERWKELQELAESLGTGSPHTLSLRDQIDMQGYREYAQRLRSLQLEQNQLNLQLAEAETRQESEYLFSEQELQFAIDNHPEVVIHRQRIEELDARLREMSEVVQGEDSPRLKQLKADLEYYESRMQKSIADMRPKIRDEMQRRSVAEREEETAEFRQKMAILNQEEEFLRGMLSRLEDDFDREDGYNGVRLEMIRHEIDREEGVADSLWRSLEQLKIEEQAQTRVSMLEEAKLPTVASRSKQYRASMAGLVIGVFGVVFVVGYFEWKTCRIRDPKDLSRNTRIRLFGAGSFSVGLPWWWRLRHAKSDPILSGVSEIASQMRIGNDSGRAASLFVSSAVCSEPRDAVARELAVAIAITGQRVLLVDSVGSNSKLAHCFTAHSASALKSIDFESCGPRDWIFSTSNADLDFCSLGAGTKEGGGKVATRRLAQLLEWASTRYDAIVVHGDSVLTTPESVLLASQLDATVLTLVLGKSRWNLMASAQERCMGVGAPVMGAILHSPHHSNKLELGSIGTPQQETKSDEDLAFDRIEAELAREISELQQEVRNQDNEPNQEGTGRTKHDQTK